jgi:hypothetical protein
VPGVESGLPATGLGLGEIEFIAQLFQHIGHAQADLGKQLIDQAGDEQRDTLDHRETSIVAGFPLPLRF